MDAIGDDAFAWKQPARLDILRWPLPYRGLADRLLLKAVALAVRRQVAAICGLEHLSNGPEPFILVANHNTRRDAVVRPAFLLLRLGGQLIHFFADWNFQLIPGVGLVYRRAGAIVVGRKPARPRILNFLKPYYVSSVAPIERSRRHLAAGRPIGVFPEGTVNRRPGSLLAGRNGAARLSLEAGVPILPVGVRFPDANPTRRSVGPMRIHIGAPRKPPTVDVMPAPQSAVGEWHATLMTDIARLSGKTWKPRQGELR